MESAPKMLQCVTKIVDVILWRKPVSTYAISGVVASVNSVKKEV